MSMELLTELRSKLHFRNGIVHNQSTPDGYLREMAKAIDAVFDEALLAVGDTAKSVVAEVPAAEVPAAEVPAAEAPAAEAPAAQEGV